MNGREYSDKVQCIDLTASSEEVQSIDLTSPPKEQVAVDPLSIYRVRSFESLRLCDIHKQILSNQKAKLALRTGFNCHPGTVTKHLSLVPFHDRNNVFKPTDTESKPQKLTCYILADLSVKHAKEEWGDDYNKPLYKLQNHVLQNNNKRTATNEKNYASKKQKIIHDQSNIPISYSNNPFPFFRPAITFQTFYLPPAPSTEKKKINEFKLSHLHQIIKNRYVARESLFDKNFDYSDQELNLELGKIFYGNEKVTIDLLNSITLQEASDAWGDDYDQPLSVLQNLHRRALDEFILGLVS